MHQTGDAPKALGENMKQTTTDYCKKAMLAEAQDTGSEYCPACGGKDKTIAKQAESSVNLTRSIDKIIGAGPLEKKLRPPLWGVCLADVRVCERLILPEFALLTRRRSCKRHSADGFGGSSRPSEDAEYYTNTQGCCRRPRFSRPEPGSRYTA